MYSVIKLLTTHLCDRIMQWLMSQGSEFRKRVEQGRPIYQDKEVYLRRTRNAAKRRIRDYNRRKVDVPVAAAPSQTDSFSEIFHNAHMLLNKTKSLSDTYGGMFGKPLTERRKSNKRLSPEKTKLPPISFDRDSKEVKRKKDNVSSDHDHSRQRLKEGKKTTSARSKIKPSSDTIAFSEVEKEQFDHHMRKLTRPRDCRAPGLLRRPLYEKERLALWQPSHSIVEDYDRFMFICDSCDKPVLLGRGAFGRVYLVENMVESIQYALKVFVADGVTRPPQIEEEGNKLMSANKRHIGPAFRGFFPLDHKDSPYLHWGILTDVVYGQTLAHYLKKNRTHCDVLKWTNIMHDVVRQVATLNRCGVSLRDVSMANIMIDDLTGRVTLVDFAKCKAMDSANQYPLSKVDAAKVCILMEQINQTMGSDMFRTAIDTLKETGLCSWETVLNVLAKVHIESKQRNDVALRMNDKMKENKK